MEHFRRLRALQHAPTLIPTQAIGAGSPTGDVLLAIPRHSLLRVERIAAVRAQHPAIWIERCLHHTSGASSCITASLRLPMLALHSLELSTEISPLVAAGVAAPPMGRLRQGAAAEDNATRIAQVGQSRGISSLTLEIPRRRGWSKTRILLTSRQGSADGSRNRFSRG